MGIKERDRKILWGRAGSRCSICKKHLFSDKESGSIVNIGEECHIHANKEKGKRWNPNLSEEGRNSYDNLILLCCNHHTEIDSDEEIYTVEKLHKIKNNHEEWVNERLSDEVIFDDDDIEIEAAKIQELCDWINENTDYYNINNDNINMAIDILLNTDKLARSLLVKILNYKEKYGEINILNILSKFTESGNRNEIEFFNCIYILEQNKFIEFDQTFETYEDENGDCILLTGSNRATYIHKECYLDINGMVINAMRMKVNDKKKFKNIIKNLDIEF